MGTVFPWKGNHRKVVFKTKNKVSLKPLVVNAVASETKVKCMACLRSLLVSHSFFEHSKRRWSYVGFGEVWMKFRNWQTFRNGVFRNGWPLSVEVYLMDCCCYLLADFQKYSLKWIVIDLWNEYKWVLVVMFYLGSKKKNIGNFYYHIK